MSRLTEMLKRYPFELAPGPSVPPVPPSIGPEPKLDPIEAALLALTRAVHHIDGGSDESLSIYSSLNKREPLCIDWSLAEILGTAREETDAETDQWQMLLEARAEAGPRLLDFGCGVKGEHRTFIEGAGYHWHGLEYADTLDPGTSPEIARLSKDPDVTLYDGGKIPLPDASFDVVFSNQSLEHVQDCNLSFSEIARVLRPGGFLIGSVSQLEAYHGHSTYNYTPYGFKVICERYGMGLKLMTPGVDAFSLILRMLLARLGHDTAGVEMLIKNSEKSPLYRMLGAAGARENYHPRDINTLKLNLCGQFRFWMQKI